MKHSIFGISFDNAININDKFDCIMDDGDEVVYESKDTFLHEEEDLTFEYKYLIRTCILDDERVAYSLILVPNFYSLAKKWQEDVLDMTGLEDGDDVTPMDIEMEGMGITFGNEVFDGTETDEMLLNCAATACELMDRLRGFYLDKCINRIGTTGWDWLKRYVCGKSIAFFD